MKVALFINGEEPDFLIDLTQYDYVHCTDGALDYLLKKGIVPDVISGDFDSIDPDQILDLDSEIIQTFDQEFPDFEKALQIIYSKGVEMVHVYGASGKQQDHFLGNLTSAFKYKDRMTLIFYDNYSYYFFAEKKMILESYKDRIISLMPFYETKGIVTEGLEYPLNKEDLHLFGRVGTRNKAISEKVSIEFEEGNLLIFIMNQ